MALSTLPSELKLSIFHLIATAIPTKDNINTPSHLFRLRLSSLRALALTNKSFFALFIAQKTQLHDSLLESIFGREKAGSYRWPLTVTRLVSGVIEEAQRARRDGTDPNRYLANEDTIPEQGIPLSSVDEDISALDRDQILLEATSKVHLVCPTRRKNATQVEDDSQPTPEAFYYWTIISLYSGILHLHHDPNPEGSIPQSSRIVSALFTFLDVPIIPPRALPSPPPSRQWKPCATTPWRPLISNLCTSYYKSAEGRLSSSHKMGVEWDSLRIYVVWHDLFTDELAAAFILYWVLFGLERERDSSEKEMLERVAEAYARNYVESVEQVIFFQAFRGGLIPD